MANTNKTVAERLRETANGKSQYPGCELLVSVATGSARCRQDANTCTECKGKNLKDLADMIEAEQAELRAENERLCRDFYEPCARMGFTEHAHGIEVVFDAMSRAAQGHECRVDFKALNLLCDKLECGDANHRATAAQIRKAMNGVKRSNDGVDVDALKFCADYLDKIGHCDIAETIRAAFEGETYELFKQAPQLPEGIEWPRFEDGELVKMDHNFMNAIWDKNGPDSWVVTSIEFESSGRAIIRAKNVFEEDCDKIELNRGERVKRPEPEVLDAPCGNNGDALRSASEHRGHQAKDRR